MVKRTLRKAQAGVIGGIIILAIIFSIAIPLILQYQRGSETIVTKISEKVNVAYERLNEKLSIQGIPLTTENLAAGLVPGIFINNTGTQPVTIKRIWLIWENGTLYKIIDLVNYTKSNLIERITLNPGTPQASILQDGMLPMLQPGETMHVKFRLTTEEVESLTVYVESAMSVLHPRYGSPVEIMPLIQEAGGAEGEIQWRGLYMPISGFKLIGYDNITRMAAISLERGSRYDYYDDRYAQSYIYDDPNYPGYYMVTVQRDWGSTWYVWRGFIGTYTTYTVSTWFGSRDYTYLDGYYTEYYECSPNFNPDDPDFSLCTQMDSGTITTVNKQLLVQEDLDHNGVSELVLNTIEDSSDWDDVAVARIMVLKTITNADFIRVSTKINYYWKMTFTGDVIENFRPLRFAMIAIYKYDPARGWVFTHYKDFVYSGTKPRTFVLEATFPVNRSDIYRVAVFLIDPYRKLPTYSGPGYGELEFRIGLEHIIVEYGVNNPFLEVVPPVFILAIPDINYTYIGNGRLDDLEIIVASLLQSLGISGYIVIDDVQMMQALLLDEPPKNAIVINLHGGTIPVPDKNSYNWLTIYQYIVDNNWVWVNLLVGSPTIGFNPPNWYLADPNGPGQAWPADIALTYLTGNPTTINLVYNPADATLTPYGTEIKAKLLALDLPDQTTIQWYFENQTILGSNPIPYYIAEVNGQNQTYSLAIPVTDSQQTLQGYLVITGFGPLNWKTPTQDQASPEIAARTAVYFALHAWLQLTSR